MVYKSWLKKASSKKRLLVGKFKLAHIAIFGQVTAKLEMPVISGLVQLSEQTPVQFSSIH